MNACASRARGTASLSTLNRLSPLRAHVSISNLMCPRSVKPARNSISPASMCRARVTKRKLVGVRSITRTGPSQGPGRRTTNSVPTSRVRERSSSPVSKLDTSPGAAALRSAASAEISSPGSIAASVKSIQK